MAAFNKFYSTVAFLANGGFTLSSDTVKVMLTNTVPVNTNTTYSSISGNEVANGNGYTTGGATVTITSSTQSSGTYKLLPTAGVTFTATGAVGPFEYAVCYDSTTGNLIGWWSYGSAVTLASGDTFTVGLDTTNGIFQLA